MADSRAPQNDPRAAEPKRTRRQRRAQGQPTAARKRPTATPARPPGKKQRTVTPLEHPIGSDTIHDPLVGKTIGGCHILEPLGKGAMGAVYKAQQVSLDRVVALKTIREDFCSDDGFLKRFRHEARVVGRFKTPYVVQIHDVGCDQGVHFITMEYVSNGNLLSYLKSQPDQRLSVGDAVRFIHQSSVGLLEAERLEIVHRDIKPENLLLDRHNQVKIADFGIARGLGATSRMTAGPGVLGTPLYMSPEQARGEDIDHRADMYALGATFFYLLTRTPPVRGDSVYDILARKLKIDFLSPKKILAEKIPDSVSRIIEKMTALNPNDRYPSFEDLCDDLQRVGAGRAPRAKTPPTQRSKAGTRKALVALAAFLLMLAGVGAVVYETRQDSGSSSLSVATAESTSDGSDANVPITMTRPQTAASDATTERTQLVTFRKRAEHLSGKLRQGMAFHEALVVWKTAQDLERELDGIIRFGPELRDDWGALHQETQAARQRSGNALAEAYRRELKNIEARLLEDPNRGLLAQAEDLRDQLPTSLDQAPKLRSAIASTVDDIRAGVSIRDEIRRIQSQTRPRFKAPFSEIATRCKELHRALTLDAKAGSVLRRWVARVREELESQVAEPVQRTTGKLMSDVNKELARVHNHEIGTHEIDALLKLVLETKSTLRECLPSYKRTWEMLIPDAKINQISESIDLAQRNEKSLEEHRSRLETIVAEIEQINSLESWRKSGPHVEAEIDAMKVALGDSAKATANGSARKLRQVIARVERESQEWLKHEKAVEAAITHLVERTFHTREARGVLKTLKSGRHNDPLAARLAKASSALTRAFDTLERSLDLDSTHTHFDTARDALTDLANLTDDVASNTKLVEAHAYSESCLKRLNLLQTLTQNMAPVLRGNVPHAGLTGQKRQVNSFFIDRLEVSTRDFRPFMVEMEQVSFEDVKDL